MSLVTAAVPFSPTAPTRLAAALGLLGLSFGAVLWRCKDRLPAWVPHAIVAFASFVVTVCVAVSTTPAGRVVTAFSYLWIALYTAWFHSDRAAALQLAGVAGGLAVALAVSDAPSPLQTWIFTTACVLGVAWTLHTLVVRLRDLADRDQLTGLLTRAAFRDVLERATAQARRHDRPLTLALIDLDDFKLVNDRDGHAVGDRVLVELATAWTGAVRRSDVLGRHGGDEFLLLMPDTTEEGSRVVLQRLAAVGTASRWTAGVAQWRGEDIADWIANADAALYASKRASRTAT
jgi:diguanylate cyclase (GGDEF)-like protein